MSTFSVTAFGSPIACLYEPLDRGMAQPIGDTLSSVKQLSPQAANILDLGSGPGEPGCTLAAAFPSATVICSDVAQAMADIASARAKSKGLENVATMVLDLADLSAIPSSSQDVATANFAIMTTANLADALREVERVLRPGGFFIGTVWHSFSVPLLASQVMTELLHNPLEPPAVDPMRPTMTEPALLDAAFAAAGLSAVEGHNTLGEITFDLGPVLGPSAWKSLLISHLARLELLEASGAATVEHIQATVEKVAAARGLIKEGRLQCPGIYRTFRTRKKRKGLSL